eukprot:CAMPEP_0116911228 /NCGR_PEP_ID=MMETSP0467-20121206/15359_1 /TAXON_ID=283647 /ORGANISM="Mesodinium pulex, Strain SPMC105" /LENGTH=114 /DNA_ID=CAMNT_0004586963 /DNA_START=1284 /DNA_END=1628 /DNA_ORIENTATION=+
MGFIDSMDYLKPEEEFENLAIGLDGVGNMNLDHPQSIQSHNFNAQIEDLLTFTINFQENLFSFAVNDKEETISMDVTGKKFKFAIFSSCASTILIESVQNNLLKQISFTDFDFT